MTDADWRAAHSLGDVIAGVSIAGLLLPEAVAYSGVAGMPPQAGMIGLLAGLVGYGIVGNSRFAIVSATSSSAAVLFAAMHSLAGTDMILRALLASGLTLLTGVLFIFAGLGRLGAISSFIAKPVLRGFAFGLALTVVIRQLSRIVAIHPQETALYAYTWDLLAHWRDWNMAGMAMAVVTLIVLRLLGRWRLVPGAMIVIACGIAFDARGLDATWGVAAVGPIHMALSAPAVPQLAAAQWLRLGELALALLLILYAESYGSIRTMALRHGDTVAPNRDLYALGVANLASGLFQGLPVGAGYSATAANEAAGAQSRGAGWVATLVVLILILTVLHWIARTPEPVLAAIVIHAVGHTLRLAPFRTYFSWRTDRTIALAAVAAVLWLGVLDGLLAGIALSLAILLRGIAQPRVSRLGRLAESHDYVDIRRHPDARATTGVLILRPESPLFFANADAICAAVNAAAGADASRTVILSLEESTDLDSTGIEALGELALTLQQQGRLLLLARVKDGVRDILGRANLPQLPPSCYESWSVDDAVSKACAVAAVSPAAPTTHPAR